MILKGSQRGGGRQLAAHLLNAKDNEHVHVHELRGFMADDLHGAFQEAYAASKGTRAKQFLFSLSLNPPPKERVSTETFEAAVERVEQHLGLVGQPRAVVFHEKDGRRHAHCVWSRIDTEHMRAINLAHFKLKLRDTSRELYMEHGWQMPRGLVNSKERDPFNCSLKEWQQMQRTGHDRKAIQQMFRDCWAMSDSGKAFTQALKARGYVVARGDLRGYVAIDYRGEAYAIAKYTGLRTRQVRDRLGDPAHLPSIEDAKRDIAAKMSATLRSHIERAEQASKLRSAAIKFQYAQTIQRQRNERESLTQAQENRWNAESANRAQRLSRGFRGIWDRLTGKFAEIRDQNEREALMAVRRDRDEKDSLVFLQIEERKRLTQRARDEKRSAALEVQRLHRDIAALVERRPAMPNVRELFDKATGQSKPQSREWSRSRDRDFEPDI